jgi:hypothetical protein
MPFLEAQGAFPNVLVLGLIVAVNELHRRVAVIAPALMVNEACRHPVIDDLDLRPYMHEKIHSPRHI